MPQPLPLQPLLPASLALPAYPPLLHPNVYPSGTVSMAMLTDHSEFSAWESSYGLKDILVMLHIFLKHMNLESPEQEEAYVLGRDQPAQLIKRQKKALEEYMRTVVEPLCSQV